MTRQTDKERKQAQQPTGTNPTQQLAARMKQIERPDKGPVPPPPMPSEEALQRDQSPPQTSPDGSQSQPALPPEPQPEVPQPSPQPQPQPVPPQQERQLPTLSPEADPLAQSAAQSVNQASPVLPASPTVFTRQPSIPAVPIPQDQMQMPAAQTLLFQLLNQNRGQNQKFHLVIIPDDENPRVVTCDTIEELLEHIRQHLDTDTSLFPFLGEPLRISKGPNRYLATPFGTLPLFALPPTDQLEFEMDGFVGVPKKEFKPPTSDEDDDDDETEEDAEAQDGLSVVIPPAVPAPVVHQDDESPVFPPD